ncbi:MAG: sugar phosphate isomerase/epimerase [Armatimonadetes bacterium]|nr:sugar phosphate isomerase/epimerase [Armatimonadota bacterium]
MNIVQELGIQSFCFRGSPTNAEVIERLKACGVAKIELSGRHVDFTDESSFAGVIQLYRDAGVEIVSIGCQQLANDPEKEEKYFRFVKQAGARFMSVNFDIATVPDAYRTAERLAEKYDVRLGIHNHGGWHWLGNRTMLAHVFGQTSERIGLCLDTAWAIDSRHDPVKMAREFGSRLYGVHLKDFIYHRDRTPEDVVVGTGILDLPGLLKAMEEVGFAGYVVLEYEGDVDNPVPALRDCVAAVRKAAGAA